MPRDAIKVMGGMAKALRDWPATLDKRAQKAEKASEQEGRGRAPRRTGRLASSFAVRWQKAHQRFDVEFPGRYLPLHFGVPSRGIPPHDFARKAIERAQDETKRALLEDLPSRLFRGR